MSWLLMGCPIGRAARGYLAEHSDRDPGEIGTRDGTMLLLLRSYGSDAEVVAASFLFTAVIFGFLPLVGFLAFGREMLRKLRAAKRE